MHYGIMMDPAEMFMAIHTGLFVTLSGIPVDDQENPKNGMVIDFTDLKKIVKRK